MDFDLVHDFSLLGPILKKRPELSPEKLKEDLNTYYLPYIKRLVNLKKQTSFSDGFIVGVSAIQGTGKTTQGEILEILLGRLGHSSYSLSIDDHYITHSQLCHLRNIDPRFIRRGVTHDIELAKRDLKKLKKMKKDEVVLISGYDKGVHHGDGDRFAWVNLDKGVQVKVKVVEEDMMVSKKTEKCIALKLMTVSYQGNPLIILDNMGSNVPVQEGFLPKSMVKFFQIHLDKELVLESKDDQMAVIYGTHNVIVPKKDLPKGWRVVAKKPDFIFYDGWMVGARRVQDTSIFETNLPALESFESREFAKFINKKLSDYEPLWDLFNFLTVLYVPNFEDSLKWRDQAEEALRQKGEGMSHDEIKEFVYYFWRSIHPGIYIKNLAHDSKHTNQVVVINDDHTIKEVLTAEEAKRRYP